MQKIFFTPVISGCCGIALCLSGCKNTQNQAKAEPTPMPTAPTATPFTQPEKTIMGSLH